MHSPQTSSRNVAIIHYTYPPVIGGVEATMQAHARVLADNGHFVKIICGAGESSNDIDVSVLPELQSLASFDGWLNSELEAGRAPTGFDLLVTRIKKLLRRELKAVNTCIIHNVMTMHFNLAFTKALGELMEELAGEIQFYLWCHDSSLLNPAYQKTIPSTHEQPWSLISAHHPNAIYVTISTLRQRQLASLLAVNSSQILVIPEGIDVREFLDIPGNVWRFAQDKGILDADIVMFFPSRIIPRKNYELGINVAHQLKQMNISCRFIVTAPPDPHNPKTARYLESLRHMITGWGLEHNVLLVSDWKEQYALNLSHREIKSLYALSDALFLTSRQEGFGIPLLEAGIRKVPIICTDIEPFPEIVDGFALRVGPD